jgi:hypothetical protein
MVEGVEGQLRPGAAGDWAMAKRGRQLSARRLKALGGRGGSQARMGRGESANYAKCRELSQKDGKAKFKVHPLGSVSLCHCMNEPSASRSTVRAV